MKATARTILSAITGIGLTAFTTISAFSTQTSAAVTTTSLGLLAIYGLVELTIRSYSPGRAPAAARALRVVAATTPSTAEPAVVVAFPAHRARACAA